MSMNTAICCDDVYGNEVPYLNGKFFTCFSCGKVSVFFGMKKVKELNCTTGKIMMYPAPYGWHIKGDIVTKQHQKLARKLLKRSHYEYKTYKKPPLGWSQELVK